MKNYLSRENNWIADLYCNISIEGSDVSEGASLGTELTWTVDKVRDGQFEL